MTERTKPLPVLERGQLRIEWEYIGEGYSGDWNPDDPDDEALLRFTVYYRVNDITNLRSGDTLAFNGWAFLDDASYCTLMPYDTPDDTLIGALELIYLEIAGSITSRNYKRTLERLSWMEPKWFSKNEDGTYSVHPSA